MPFSDDVVRAAWQRAKGKCEKCNKELVWSNRGRESGVGAWEAHHITPVERRGSDDLQNCKILCWPCHEKTF